MANHSATKKDVRQSRKRNERNRYYGKTTRNAIRDLKVIDNKEGEPKTSLPITGKQDIADVPAHSI